MAIAVSWAAPGADVVTSNQASTKISVPVTVAARQHRSSRRSSSVPVASSVGYLLRDRIADVADFVAALRRVAAGGTALDPEVVAQLLVRRKSDPAGLTPREREVLALMAEGRSNGDIATVLVVSDSAVAKHINSIFAKLGLSAADGDRRVLAVLHFLDNS